MSVHRRPRDETGSASEPGKGSGPGKGSDAAHSAADGEGGRVGRDPESAAREVVLRLLTVRPRTRAELDAALARRGTPRSAADAVLERLSEVGLVDDAAFATAWVRSRQSGRGLARRALGHELRARGVDDDTVAEALSGIDPDDELDRARRLVAARMRVVRGLPPEVQMRRLAGLLARKGYPGDLVRRVVQEAVLQPSGDDPERGADSGQAGRRDARSS